MVRDRDALPPAIAERAWAAGKASELNEAISTALMAMRVLANDDATARFPRDRYALTRREREVLTLLVDGRSDAQIADELFISPKTASVHVANIKGKLGANSRIEIVTSAIRMGLVTRPGDG